MSVLSYLTYPNDRAILYREKENFRESIFQWTSTTKFFTAVSLEHCTVFVNGIIPSDVWLWVIMYEQTLGDVLLVA